MLMKHEARNVAFGGAASVPPPHSVAGALSTSSVTWTPSGRPPLEPRTPGAHAPSLGAHARTGGALSRLVELYLTSSELAGPAIDLNRTPSTCDTTPACTKKPGRISTTDKPRAVNLFDEKPKLGSSAHRRGNVSSHLSIVIADRLERQSTASHGECTCMISWRTMARPSCMT
jgi:hypothetical protein